MTSNISWRGDRRAATAPEPLFCSCLGTDQGAQCSSGRDAAVRPCQGRLTGRAKADEPVEKGCEVCADPGGLVCAPGLELGGQVLAS